MLVEEEEVLVLAEQAEFQASAETKNAHKVINNISYHPFNFCRFCGKVLSFIPDIGNLFLLSFILDQYR